MMNTLGADSWLPFERSFGHTVMDLLQQGLIGWITTA